MMPNPILTNICRALRRELGTPVAKRPPILPPRSANNVEAEIDLLFSEIDKLTGVTRRLNENEIESALQTLVQTQDIKKAMLWQTADFSHLQIEKHLRTLGVEIISPYADKQTLARCDLGVTGVDFALPETGTLGLFSTAEKPRAVSLLPRVHLAIFRSAVLCADLHQVFVQAKNHHYLILITGPSRSADIEFTVTLGVHGPKSLYAWALR